MHPPVHTQLQRLHATTGNHFTQADTDNDRQPLDPSSHRHRQATSEIWQPQVTTDGHPTQPATDMHQQRLVSPSYRQEQATTQPKQPQATTGNHSIPAATGNHQLPLSPSSHGQPQAPTSICLCICIGVGICIVYLSVSLCNLILSDCRYFTIPPRHPRPLPPPPPQMLEPTFRLFQKERQSDQSTLLDGREAPRRTSCLAHSQS